MAAAVPHKGWKLFLPHYISYERLRCCIQKPKWKKWNALKDSGLLPCPQKWTRLLWGQTPALMVSGETFSAFFRASFTLIIKTRPRIGLTVGLRRMLWEETLTTSGIPQKVNQMVPLKFSPVIYKQHRRWPLVPKLLSAHLPYAQDTHWASWPPPWEPSSHALCSWTYYVTVVEDIFHHAL